MPRYAFAVVAEFAPNFVPAAETMDDHDFVPESPGRFDNGDIRYGQVQIHDVVAYVRSDHDIPVRIKRGLCAALNPNGGSDISNGASDGGIPDEHCLPIRI